MRLFVNLTPLCFVNALCHLSSKYCFPQDIDKPSKRGKNVRRRRTARRSGELIGAGHRRPLCRRRRRSSTPPPPPRLLSPQPRLPLPLPQPHRPAHRASTRGSRPLPHVLAFFPIRPLHPYVPRRVDRRCAPLVVDRCRRRRLRRSVSGLR